jgi:hypothetical protein
MSYNGMIKKTIIPLVAITGGIMIVIFLTLLLLGEKIIHPLVDNLENRRGLTIDYEKAKFSGFRSITIEDAQITKLNHSISFQFKKCRMRIKVLPLLKGIIRIDQLTLEDALLEYGESQQLSAGIDSTSMTRVHKPSYYDAIDKGMKVIRQLLPSRVKINNTRILVKSNNDSIELWIPELDFKKHWLEGTISLTMNENQCKASLNGQLIPERGEYWMDIKNIGDTLVYIPLPGKGENNWVRFGNAYTSLSTHEKGQGMTVFQAEYRLKDLQVSHWRLSTTPILVDSTLANLSGKFSREEIALDSTSLFQINKVKINTKVLYRNQPHKTFEIVIPSTRISASDFFESLPPGLFMTTPGIIAEGQLDFEFATKVDFNTLDSLQFKCILRNEGLKINSYGEVDYRMINNSFVHHVHENNQLVASILADQSNPGFLPFAQIPSYLKYAILTSEDGGFFHHQGFNEEAFRESIVTNLKEKRFARGGSTISMQLVKNLFLSRQKTVARKIEEALIVYLIENLRLSSKQRMFELYVNLIEWGPGIYGIKPASAYYFDKHPSELSLAESIYLTSIIPRPKAFRFYFEKDGSLKPWLYPYFHRVAGIMARREQILPTDTLGFEPGIRLRGRAKHVVGVDYSTDHMEDLIPLSPLEVELEFYPGD